MSGIINKAKDAIHQATAPKGSHHTSTVPGQVHGEHPQSANSGPHASNVGNKVDPRVDSDLDGRGAPGHSTLGHSTAGNPTVGHTNPGHSAVGTTHTTTTHGLHNSNLMNKLDPRVDSDRDGSRTAPGGGDPPHGTPIGTHTGTHTGLTGGIHTGTTHTGTHANTSTNHGHHNSNLANKLDPRIDSDRDGSRTAPGGGDPSYGAPGVGHTGTHTGVTGGTHSGITGGTHAGGVRAGTNDPLTHPRNTDPHYTDNHGPHNSNLMNKLDPRVDSDRDGSRTAPGGGDPSYSAPAVGHTGAHTGTHTGTHAGAGGIGGVSHGTHTGAGPHNSSIMNKADPRIDSDLDGSRTVPDGGHNVAAHGGHGVGTTTHSTHSTTGAYGAGTPGTTAHGVHTAGSGDASNDGPHNSKLLNKLDPRVDSDRDGSNTYGGNATHR